MKCISLWQPWASHVVSGRKLIETRHWPTNYRGDLLIHAAKTKEECSKAECGALPFGAIIGRVQLIGCQRTEELRDKITPEELHLGNYGNDRFGWLLAYPVMFDSPIPYRGSQGFFNVADEVLT